MEIYFNTCRDIIDERMKKVDILCTDLDECLFPFFTQVLVAGEILVEALFKKNKWKYIPQLIGGASVILFLIVVTFGNIRFLKNEFLMNLFARTMKRIPLDLIRKHSRYIHTFFYTESLLFLQKMSQRKVPIVILSLSIQPILDELKNNIGFIDECIGNKIIFSKKNNTFIDYASPKMTNADDKLSALMELKERHPFKTPLIIGHSDDELRMVEYARSVGGVSIGINPKNHLEDSFDIVIKSVNWSSLTQYLADL